MKLWAMPCGPPKTDGSQWKILTKHGPLEEGMANYSNILAARTTWTWIVWKGKKIWYQKMSSHVRRCQYATVEEWRAITNSSRKNEVAGLKQKWLPAVDVSGGESEVWRCKEQYCIGTWNVRSISSVRSFSCAWLFVTPWIAARQASLSITNSRSSLKFTSIESVMPSSHLILYHPLFLLPPIPPIIRVFSNESTLCMRWPKYWNFSFSIIPSKEHPGLISFRMDWLDLLAVQGTLKSLLQHCSSKVQFFSAQLSL